MRTASLGLLICLVVAGSAFAGKQEKKAAKEPLKQVTKATKGIVGVVADVDFAQVIDKKPIEGRGKLYAHFGGILRADVGGDLPRTFLLRPPYLYIHYHDDRLVEVYDISINPDRLGQYVMLGFVPNGEALKPLYDVELVGQGATLDGEPVYNFLLKPKLRLAQHSIARIQLWVDPESGLPRKQLIVHAVGDVRLEVAYLNVERDDELPDSLFLPDWPEDVDIVRK